MGANVIGSQVRLSAATSQFRTNPKQARKDL